MCSVALVDVRDATAMEGRSMQGTFPGGADGPLVSPIDKHPPQPGLAQGPVPQVLVLPPPPGGSLGKIGGAGMYGRFAGGCRSIFRHWKRQLDLKQATDGAGRARRAKC